MLTNNKTTSTSSTQLNDLLKGAQNVFNNPAVWRPNPTSQVAPLTSQQTQGLSGTNHVATQEVGPSNQNWVRVNSTLRDLGTNGLTDLQDQSVSALQGIAAGNGYNGEQQHAIDLLNPIASGDPAKNPYLDSILKSSDDAIRLNSALGASAMGRYGSGGHEGVLAKAIGDNETNLRYTDFNNQQARKDAAIQNLFNMGTTGFGQRGDALSSLYNAGQQGLGNIEGGTSALSDAYDARLDPYRTMFGAGQQFQVQNQKNIDDKNRIFTGKQGAQTAPYDWLAQLLGAGGTQTTSVPNNPLKSAIGSGISAFGATGNPLLSLLAGGASFL